jgi:hypothetical protein
VYQPKVINKINVTKNNDVCDQFRISLNVELGDLYRSPNVGDM